MADSAVERLKHTLKVITGASDKELQDFVAVVKSQSKLTLPRPRRGKQAARMHALGQYQDLLQL